MSVAPRQEDLSERVHTIRRFNRFYTQRIGLLQSRHLGTEFSLTEARILFELGQQPALTAKQLCDALGLDQGYVSRILSRFEKDGLISRQASKDDGRVQHIALTKAGRKVQTMLDTKASQAIAALLENKSENEQRELASAAQAFTHILGDEAQASGHPVIIRQPEPGDLGWIVYRHGVLYASEYGWDASFEGLTAEIVAAFAKNTDKARERCWVAECDGHILGAVFLVRDDDETARLRLLYVEPEARGQGVGRKLVELCINFARGAGYRRIVLWTHDVLVAARQIYRAYGFELIENDAHRAFGKDVVSEVWKLELA